MQHIVYHVVLRDSLAFKFDRADIAFIVSFILLAEPLADEEGRKPEYPKKTPDYEFQQKNIHVLKAVKSKPQPRLEPAL